MTPRDYWNMCSRHLSDTDFIIIYIIMTRLLLFNEYNFLIKPYHEISNFYMLPKLHKSQEINEIIEIKRTEYIQIDKDISIEGQPILAGPVFHKSKIPKILHYIMEPPLSLILHIVKDSLDFTQRLEKQCQNNTLLSTWDIKPFKQL